ncbi:RNA polymerase sigma24 factor [Longispora fulva]|uniref:RNA polymerase sigma-70 factor (Sigma-E family) n=1 Tax=Longispora fulva TaxID=619741 RepID=A0A8J7GKD5_9ACTN|nr:SigE family RNA polymerase sigma factor [Longispora fulva]MBG6134504.1 RNA polymerase sigma-70 factor (sigma-E family) [Longispora fulva]GIG62583.1 RNA polymerase sigma24 factor [Longispora fulva]
MTVRDEQYYVDYVRLRTPWLRRVAYLLCQDWHRADDLVQVTITRLYVHWRKASRTDNLDGYVRTMLLRVFLSEQRTGWRARVRLFAEPPERSVAPTGEHDPDTGLTVRAALRAVPERQRATLVLRYYLDLSVAETAEILRCSEGTVKSQTARGLDALRRTLTTQES